MEETIDIKNAHVNNLKGIDVKIPRNKLVVVTGLSGSGKSSLAFDTLYAEGQRRYVESLSAYARQFLGRMSKPQCDYIHGLPPAIAIEQKVVSRNPRSTVGTSTEIYEYLRMLYARIGRTISPVSGQEVKRHTTEDVVQCMLSYSPGTRFTVQCPVVVPEGRTLKQQLEMLMKQGFIRLEAEGEIVDIVDYLDNIDNIDDIEHIENAENLKHSRQPRQPQSINLVVDRLAVSNSKDAISRLVDSAETAFYEGGGTCILKFYPAGIVHVFSTRFEADGITFEPPTDNLFAFNSPMGACPECEGFGRVIGIDESLVIPNSSLSVYDGAVVCWRGEKMGEWREEFIRTAKNFPIFEPYFRLSEKDKDYLWHRSPCSIDRFFDMVRENQYKIQYRVMLARYRGKTLCPVCHGHRLRKEAGYVQVGGRSISQLVDLPITVLADFFGQLKLSEHEEKVAKRLLTEIRSRLQFLIDVGLGYLTLNRASNSLSGGESQRINLATSLGSSLVGSLYVLDEPSIGLHSRDTQKLLKVLRQLQQLGNTVVVVEHDEDIIRAADYIIDIGPEAGRLGGQVVYAAPPPAPPHDGRGVDSSVAIEENHTTPLPSGGGVRGRGYTLAFLSGIDTIPVPASRRSWNRSIIVRGARANNLKGIDVTFPLNVMTVVTGVSGSGKSTLVRDILYNALKRRFDEVADRPGEHIAIEGDLDALHAVEFVDQNPIGRSTRSNPVTYVKAYDEIRHLYASLPLSKQMGFGAGTFSFNTEGGRCEECKGEGTVTVEMQFMADLVLECESCHGRRFKSETLEVKFEGQSIADILDMTVNQAVEFFTAHTGKNTQCKRIVQRLLPLQQVGLGYIKLGQTSATLSGGENQRVKLAYYLGMEKVQPTMFIFDEPTTGLHFHDIRRLLAAFDALIERGHTVVIIEHNLDVAKQADHIIDLGPEGGDRGGELVVCGTPEQVMECEDGYTGQYLRKAILRQSAVAGRDPVADE